MAARRGGSGKGKKARGGKKRESAARLPKSPARNTKRDEAPSAPARDVEAKLPEAPPAPLPEREVGAEVDSELPIADESRLQLPDLPTGPSVRRRRRRKSGSASEPAQPSAQTPAQADGPLPSREIERLTRAYRSGGEEARELIQKIEVEPDFMFRDGQAAGEYELASAIIGTGRPNKQGVYVLPYLQSAHLVLLGVLLLGTFVYYPGFPLTEGSDELRSYCRLGLALTYTLNAALAVFAVRAAKRRNQPPAFWAAKVALLGNIALQELLSNAPVTEARTRRARKQQKQ